MGTRQTAAMMCYHGAQLHHDFKVIEAHGFQKIEPHCKHWQHNHYTSVCIVISLTCGPSLHTSAEFWQQNYIHFLEANRVPLLFFFLANFIFLKFLNQKRQRNCIHKTDTKMLPLFGNIYNLHTSTEFWQQKYIHFLAAKCAPCFKIFF